MMYFQGPCASSMLFWRCAKRHERPRRGAFSMKQLRIALLVALVLVLLAAACGGDEDVSVPGDAIAVVDGNEIAKTEFDGLIGQAKKSYKAQKRTFPKTGTAEYNVLKNQAVQFLVQRAQFEQKAEELDVEVTDKQVEARLKQIQKQYFAGDKKRYDTQLKQQGLTDEQVRRDIRAQLVQEGIFKQVTETVKVTDKDDPGPLQQEQVAVRHARDTRRATHPRRRRRSWPTTLYTRLKAGEDFAKLAKQFSKDPGSKDQGGKLTVAARARRSSRSTRRRSCFRWTRSRGP